MPNFSINNIFKNNFSFPSISFPSLKKENLPKRIKQAAIPILAAGILIGGAILAEKTFKQTPPKPYPTLYEHFTSKEVITRILGQTAAATVIMCILS